MFLKKIKSSGFMQSFFQLALGSIIAQLLTAVCSPIITRLFSVNDMGIYALILSISSIFGGVINGKYDAAIVSSKDEEDIVPLIQTSTIISLVLSLIIFFFLLMLKIFNFHTFKPIGNELYLVVILLIVLGLNNTLNAYNNRYKEYKTISNVYLTRVSSQNVLIIFSGLIKMGSTGLILSQIVGSLAGITRQGKDIFTKKDVFKVSIKNIFFMIKKYKEFFVYSVPSNLANSLSYSILNFFISGLFGLKVLGLYSMTYRILGLPLSLVSVNISKVFFKDGSDEYRENGSFFHSLKKATALLSIVAIPMVVILVLFSPTLFKVFFGEEWQVAGVYAQVLAPMFGIRLIVSALTPGFMIVGKQNKEFYFQILFLINSIFVFVIGFYLKIDEVSFLIIYSILNSLIYIIFYFSILKISRREKND